MYIYMCVCIGLTLAPPLAMPSKCDVEVARSADQ